MDTNALIGYSFYDDVAHNVEYAADQNSDYIHGMHCVTTSIVDRAHRARLAVNVGTVRESDTVEQLCEQGSTQSLSTIGTSFDKDSPRSRKTAGSIT